MFAKNNDNIINYYPDKNDFGLEVIRFHLPLASYVHIYDGFNQIGRLFVHEFKPFLAAFKTVALVSEHRGRINTAILNEIQETFCPASAAWAKTTGKPVVGNKPIEISCINGEHGRCVSSNEITNTAARASELICNWELFCSASCDDSTVNSLATGKLHDLFKDVAIFVIDHITCPINTSKVSAVLSGTYRNNSSGTSKLCRNNCHKANRTTTNNYYGVAKLNIRKFHAVETGGHHIADHQSTLKRNTLGNFCGVHLNIVNDVVLGHNAVLTCADTHALAEATRMLESAVLHFYCAPIGSSAGNYHDIADFVLRTTCTEFYNAANGLVT